MTMLSTLRNWFNRPSAGPGQTELTAEQRRHWDENGFLVLPGWFQTGEVDALLAEVDGLWNGSAGPANPLVVDPLEGPYAGKRSLMRELPRDTQHFSHKLNDLYLESARCRSLILEPKLVNVLRGLLQDEPVVINSLNFEKGSRQSYHFDTYYMPPPVDGQMAVTSICLEDVNPAAGPLMYYPGSHKIAPFRFEHGGIHKGDADLEPAQSYIQEEIDRRALTSETFCGKKGDVFIWHAQLYHGGSMIEDQSLTRRSVVTHYWGQKGMSGKIRRTSTGGHFLDRHHQPVSGG